MKAFRALALTAMAVCALHSSQPAAQQYPSKAVRGIVPFAAGGQSDVVARIIGQKLSERWSQPLLIENRAGANGNIGTEAVVKSAPDGYTLFFPTSTLAVNAVIAPIPGFDVLKDLAAISLTGYADVVLTIAPTLPVNTLQELVAYAKANPGKLNYGTTAIGASGHIGMEQLKITTGADIQMVNYTTIANLISDLLSGRIAIFMTPPASVLAHIKAGKLKALGVTGRKRLTSLQDVPTIVESYPDFRMSTWYAVFAPEKTPADIVSKVGADIRWALGETDLRDKMAATGVDAEASTPDELRTLIRREIDAIAVLKKRGAL